MPAIAAPISLLLETGSTASCRTRSKASSNRLSSSKTVSLSANFVYAAPAPGSCPKLGWVLSWAKPAQGTPSATTRIAAANPRICIDLRKSAHVRAAAILLETLREESRHYHGVGVAPARRPAISFLFGLLLGRKDVADLADPAGGAALQFGAEPIVRHQPGVRLEHFGGARAGRDDVEDCAVVESAANGDDFAGGGGAGRGSLWHRDGLRWSRRPERGYFG